MLAPLKDRSVLEREPDADEPAMPDNENTALRLALKEARKAQKRAATLAAAKIAGLEQANRSLADTHRQLQTRIAELESSQAIISLGQQLMALRNRNDELSAGLRQLWALDRNLCAAHRECERLARERDLALADLQASTARQSRY